VRGFGRSEIGCVGRNAKHGNTFVDYATGDNAPHNYVYDYDSLKLTPSVRVRRTPVDQSTVTSSTDFLKRPWLVNTAAR